MPLVDIICKRALLFAKKCLTSSSEIVRYVSEYDVYYGRNFSVMGCNVLFGCEYFKMSLDDFIHYDSVGEYIVQMSLRKRDTESYSRALCFFELLMLRRHAYCVCLDVAFLPEIVKLRFLTCVMAGIRFGLCLTYVLVYFYYPDCLCFIFLYFEYDFIINKYITQEPIIVGC